MVNELVNDMGNLAQSPLKELYLLIIIIYIIIIPFFCLLSIKKNDKKNKIYEFK